MGEGEKTRKAREGTACKSKSERLGLLAMEKEWRGDARLLVGKGGGRGERIHCRACHVRWAQDRNLQRISQGREREGEGALMSQSSSAQRLSRGKLAPEIERIKGRMWKPRLLHEHPSLPAALWPLPAFHSPTGRLHARPRLAPCCPLTGDAALQETSAFLFVCSPPPT